MFSYFGAILLHYMFLIASIIFPQMILLFNVLRCIDKFHISFLHFNAFFYVVSHRFIFYS